MMKESLGNTTVVMFFNRQKQQQMQKAINDILKDFDATVEDRMDSTVELSVNTMNSYDLNDYVDASSHGYILNNRKVINEW